MKDPKDTRRDDPADLAVTEASPLTIAPPGCEANSDTSPLAERRDAYFEQLLMRQTVAWEAHQPQTVEQFVELFILRTGSNCTTDEMLALICNEMYLRESHAQSPTLEEYQQRFPQLAEELQIQWEVDRILAIEQSQPDVHDSALRFPAGVLNHATFQPRDQTLDTHPTGCESIGRYEIRREVGRGAIGVVFEAFDLQLKRTVAVKRLRSGLDAGQEELSRMRAEAEAVAKLQHANIVQIFDIGESQGVPFLAMEFCSGGNLGKRLGGQPILPKLAAELMRRVAAGVAAAHDCRVIHRDLKPGNVLLERTSDWSPKVADFGLAKLLDSDSGATATGSILGTPSYMAPEQAFGDAKRVGPAADIYSLGAILYECLTGRPPFRGSSIAETLEQVRSREPLAVRQLEPKVPLDLETITHKCLRKDPSQRYASAEEFIDDLNSFLELKPIKARRERWQETAWRVVKRYPLTTSLATASVLLLLTVTIGSLVFARNLYEAREETRKEKIAAQLGQAEALVGRAHGIRLSRQPGQRFDALHALRQAAKIGRETNQPDVWFEPIRDEAIAALQLPDALVQEFREEKLVVENADFSNDHRLYALSFTSGDISLRRTSDHQELASIPRSDAHVRLAFIGKEHLFLFGNSGGACELWDVSGSIPHRKWRCQSAGNTFEVAPDGKLVAVCGSKILEIIDTQTGATLANMDIKPFTREPRVALHPTHPYLVINTYVQPTVELRNWKTGECFLSYRPNDFDDVGFSGAAWSPNGKMLVLISGHSRALRWFNFDPERLELTLQRTHELSNHGGGMEIRFNAKGDLLLEYGWTRQFGILDAIGGNAVFNSAAMFGTFAPRAPRVDPMDQWAGFFQSIDDRKQIGVMSLSSGSEQKLLIPPEFSQVFVDPTGQFLAAGKGNQLRFVEVATRKVLGEFALEGFVINSICFDDQQNMLVNSLSGSLRWPYRISDTKPPSLEFGIPERIHIVGGNGSLASDRAGTGLAGGFWNGLGTQEYAGCWIKSAAEPAARKFVGYLTGGACDFSPDGRFAATSSDGGQTRIFDCDKNPVEVIRLPGLHRIRFSGDGGYLLAGGKLWQTDTWNEIPRKVEGQAHDMSFDGRQIASQRQSGVVSLSDAQTGKVYARIEGKDPAFFPNSNSLMVRTEKGTVLCDLAAIGRGVAELGLPWQAPNAANIIHRQPIEGFALADELNEMDSADELYALMDARALERIDFDPDNGQWAFDAALAAIENRDFATALKHLNRACVLLPAAITTRMWRAYLLAEMQNWSDAIQDANWILAQMAEPEVQLLRAEWYYRRGQFTRAIEDCTQAMLDQPKLTVRAIGLRSVCHRALGNNEAAEIDRQTFNEECTEAMDSLDLAAYPMVGPDLSLRHPVIANLYADKMLSLKVELEPEYRYTIGLVFYRNGRFGESIKILAENLRNVADPYFASTALLTSLCYVRQGKSAEARHYEQLAAAWMPPAGTTFLDRRSVKLLRAELAGVSVRVPATADSQ